MLELGLTLPNGLLIAVLGCNQYDYVLGFPIVSDSERLLENEIVVCDNKEQAAI